MLEALVTIDMQIVRQECCFLWFIVTNWLRANEGKPVRRRKYYVREHLFIWNTSSS